MKSQWLTILICGLLLALTQTGWARKWTDNTGKFSVEAELVEVKDDKVVLKRTSGTVITLPVARLSKTDRRYLQTLAQEPTNEPLGRPPEVAPEVIAAWKKARAVIFDAIAKDIEKSVLRLDYPKSTADDLVQLVRDWNCELWKQNLARARAGSASSSAAEVARVEEITIRALYERIERKIAPGPDFSRKNYFHLSEVVRDRRAHCLGYSQVFYILGKTIGLRVRAIYVLELVSGENPPGIGHVACLVSRSDGQVVIVDLAQRYVSRPFVFKEGFVEAGNYWQLKQQDNPLRVHPRIGLLDESGLLACIYSSLAAVNTNAGHPDQAISDFTKAIELNPKDAIAFNNRGVAHDSLGQHEQAISDYNKAIELNPKYADAFYNRGIAHRNLGQHEQAISDYNKAIELSPKDAIAFIGRGVTAATLGKTDAAKRDLQKALALNTALRPQIQRISDQFKLGL